MTQHKDLTGTDLHINKLHATTHEDGGTDEISLTGLAGAPALGSATTAVTQSPGDNSTKVSTTAYADAAAAAAAGTYTDEKAQDAIGAMVDSTIVYTDATPLLSRAALTGDVTASAGSNATTIASGAVTGSKIAPSVALAGSPTTTTQSANDNSTKIATTAYADAIAALKASLAGATFTGAVAVPDDAYDATTWNGSTNVPTKNAVRDKIESLSSGTTADDASAILAGQTFGG